MPAGADHVFPNSSVTCGPQDPVSGTFDCVLTILIYKPPFPGPIIVRAEDDEVVGVTPIGASFATLPERTGGTCAPTSIEPAFDADGTKFGARANLVLTGDLLGGCTIVLHEALT